MAAMSNFRALQMTTPDGCTRARACIDDAERPENSLSMRVDAAILAALQLESFATKDPIIAEYLLLKYERPLPDAELEKYLAHALALANTLLSLREQS